VVDVREPDEWEAGHISGAKLLPRGLLKYRAAEELPDKDVRIVVHCALAVGRPWRPRAAKRWDTRTSPKWGAA
jgi:rhodanese-related sulfurtransferase